MQELGESISVDWKLYPYDIQGSRAHAAVLEAAGILTPDERAQIEAGLTEIEAEIRDGRFPFSKELEDIHMNVEAELTRKIGPAGAKLHTARSRNDQVATDLRLFVLNLTVKCQEALRRLQLSVLKLASDHAEVVMPGYTHLQRAQPVYFAHHLLAYMEMLERDAQRFEDSIKRSSILPLGSGAMAGSTIALDREKAREALGFLALSHNSMDAVSDRDFACEFVFNVALCGVHLSRLSEDLILWSTTEFDFIRIGDSYTTGSSLMPQKKNPDACELTRGAAGLFIGQLVSLLSILKGLPLTYNRDLQHDKHPLFDSAQTLLLCLEVYAGMLGDIEVNAERMKAAAGDPMLLATDVADYLVKRGMPFRQAHETVGKLVKHALDHGLPLNQLPLDHFQQISSLFAEDVRELFDPVKSLNSRTSTGAPCAQNIAAELKRWTDHLRS